MFKKNYPCSTLPFSNLPFLSTTKGGGPSDVSLVCFSFAIVLSCLLNFLKNKLFLYYSETCPNDHMYKAGTC